MPTPQKRQSKSSNKSIKAQDQVVDVTPLNSIAQSKTSSKIPSSSTQKVSSNKSIPSAKNPSNSSGGEGLTKTPIGKNKGFFNCNAISAFFPSVFCEIF